jgi:hypothetical protein
MLMRRRHALFAALLAASLAAPAAAEIKCWTNKDGVRECGDVVPPEYSQQGYVRKNERGITVEQKERAKSMEELAEERRLAALEAERKREQARQDAKDRVLLNTFASVDDIELARDGQIANIDGQIKVTENQIEKLNVNLAGLIADAAEDERRGKAPDAEVTSRIESLRQQIADNEAFIQDRRREQEALRVQYDRDIARFRELKGLPAQSSPAPASATAPASTPSETP